MITRFTCLLLFIGTVCSLQAQTTGSSEARHLPARIGPYFSGSLNFSDHSIGIWQNLPSLAPYDAFRDGLIRFTYGSASLAFAGGGSVMFPLSDSWHIGGKAGVNWLNATSSHNQFIGLDTTIRHSLEVSEALLELSPTVELHEVFSFPLYFTAGIEFGIPIGSSHTQSVILDSGSVHRAPEVTSPTTSVSSTSVRSAIMIGAGYSIPLSNTAWLQPEVSLRLPLTNVSSSADYSPWSVTQLRFGVNLMFSLAGSATDNVDDNTDKATARFGPVTAIDAGGREYDVQNLSVEDVTYTEMFPLVPYIFYPENGTTPESSAQNTEFRTERGEFIPEKLELDAMEVNRNLLNIVGSRMQQIPHSTLTITGTADGAKENGKGALPSQRGQWAKDYLVQAFAIKADRISVVGAPRPAAPSSLTDPEGVAENRRAELTSNVPDVLEPLIITADNQRIATPSVVMFHPIVEHADSVSKWILSITQAGRPLRELTGTGTPKSITWPIKPNELSTAQVPVDYVFSATTSNGQQVEATGTLAVDYMSSVRKKTENLPDRTIDKYSLILFDFDKATLNADNQRILEKMVLPAIKANSSVSIIGYTDRIGTEDYNKKLSAERANTVKAFLQSRATDARYTAMGVGESSEIYPNILPTGRQLSRTVQIIIETKR